MDENELVQSVYQLVGELNEKLKICQENNIFVTISTVEHEKWIGVHLLRVACFKHIKRGNVSYAQ